MRETRILSVEREASAFTRYPGDGKLMQNIGIRVVFEADGVEMRWLMHIIDESSAHSVDAESIVAEIAATLVEADFEKFEFFKKCTFGGKQLLPVLRHYRDRDRGPGICFTVGCSPHQRVLWQIGGRWIDWDLPEVMAAYPNGCNIEFTCAGDLKMPATVTSPERFRVTGEAER